MEAISGINEDITSIVYWATANQLVLNEAKTQTIIVGIIRYVSSIDLETLPSIMVGPERSWFNLPRRLNILELLYPTICHGILRLVA